MGPLRYNIALIVANVLFELLKVALDVGRRGDKYQNIRLAGNFVDVR